ncbi:MAG: Ig-like domain-containing protein, partial [Planctomycetes bacterium]|nr:Ig-like domain-containing protein [Planctomycetota bacterium]
LPRYHTIFTGPEGFLGLEVLIREDDPDESDGAPLMLGGFQVIIDGQLILTPTSATNFLPQDDTHTVTATLVEAEPPFDPISGATIVFVIESGPNMGVVGTCSVNADCTTDANGKVSFTYTSNGIYSLVPDVIRARWEVGDDEDAVEKLWLPCHCEDIQPKECTDDGDCDDGAFCNGVETCNVPSGNCQAGVNPCGAGETCDEENDECIEPAECADDGDCDDGAFCNGAETCDVPSGTCQPGTDPCEAGDTCDEDNDECVPPAESDCCIPHPTPGCDDEACEALVCGQDPFCCDPLKIWDFLCVNQAVALCGELCEAPSAEGACCDGETCSVTTEADCIDGGGEYQGDEEVCDPNPCAPVESDCCIPHGTPGCDDEACEALVCAQDPFCCDPLNNWDSFCVDAAEALCGELCEAPVEGACCEAGDVDTCMCFVATAEVCADEGGQYKGDDTGCDANPCVPPGESDCCCSHATPGCDDEVCQDIVCNFDPDCCDPIVNWDPLCVSEAVLLCGGICGALPPPVNDECADKLVIFDGVTEFSTSSATTDGGDTDCTGDCCDFGDPMIHNDVWYNYDATCSGTLTVSTCDTVNYDSKIGIYDGCGACPYGGNEIGCNDDGEGCPLFSSLATADVVQGNCYTVRIGAFSPSDAGSGTVLVDCAP